jgi:predicted small integral membrane protein
MTIRLSKICCVFAVAFFASLVVFNNLTDYGSNYAFVYHVLKMDTTFPDNGGMWRAIDYVPLYGLFYKVLIAIEACVALLCWYGGYRLLMSIMYVDEFNQSKGVAVLGLTLGILLWFTGFMSIGGEWFLMWQSQIWNGVESSFRFVVVIFMVLLYLVQPDLT